jgi:hypothetical protein
MQIVTRQYEVYSFSELSKEAQKKAIKQYRESNEFEIDLDSDLENLKLMLIEKGYENPKIFFSHSYSQGDGACFTANVTDNAIFRLISENKEAFPILSKDRHKNIITDYLCVYIVNIPSLYSHEHTKKLEIINNLWHYDKRIDNLDSLSQELEKLVKMLEKERIELSKQIFVSLRDSYDDQDSSEAISERLSLEDNNNNYFACGKLFV